MSTSAESTRWTWDAIKHPGVLKVFSSNTSTCQWFYDLETDASDAVTGKVLCVVAGVAIAHAIITKEFLEHEQLQESLALLDLADDWIDNPTDQRFDQITQFLFGDGSEWEELGDPGEVVWSALRIATSSIGNFEAGWALGLVVDYAHSASVDALAISREAVQSREKQSKYHCPNIAKDL